MRGAPLQQVKVDELKACQELLSVFAITGSPLSAGVTFQNPETKDSTEPYAYCDSS